MNICSLAIFLELEYQSITCRNVNGDDVVGIYLHSLYISREEVCTLAYACSKLKIVDCMVRDAYVCPHLCIGKVGNNKDGFVLCLA